VATDYTATVNIYIFTSYSTLDIWGISQHATFLAFSAICHCLHVYRPISAMLLLKMTSSPQMSK